MEISFSAALTSSLLGPGSAACSFIGHPQPDGRYQWRGRGALFLSVGTVSTRSVGQGHRQGSTIFYRGGIIFHAHVPSLGWLNDLKASFEYVQDMVSLEVRLHCHETNASPNSLLQNKGTLHVDASVDR